MVIIARDSLLARILIVFKVENYKGQSEMRNHTNDKL